MQGVLSIVYTAHGAVLPVELGGAIVDEAAAETANEAIADFQTFYQT
jgi:hypothetical protein